MYLYVLFFSILSAAKVNIFKYLGKDYLQKFFFKGGRKFGYLQK